MTGPAVWQPYHEPFRTTVARTGLLGLALGTAAAFVQGHPANWALGTVFASWFTFGGHWVEILFLNWLRPRLPVARAAQVTGRVLTWIVGGTALMVGARMTVTSLSAHALRLPSWWLGGPVLVGIELLVHALIQLRGQPNFYNGAR